MFCGGNFLEYSEVMISKFKIAARIILVLKNWLSALVAVFITKRDVLAVFRNGEEFFITKQTWAKFNSVSSFYRHFPDGKVSGTIATVEYEGKKLSFDFADTAPGPIAEFFGKRFPYRIKFDTSIIKNRVVVDIGPFLGDSPVWFAVHGAKKVYCFEPSESNYALCRRNIELNGYGETCLAIKAAITGERGDNFLKLEADKKIFGLGSTLNDHFLGNIPALTLGDVIEKYSIGSGAFLKIDCEGYEYDILLNSTDDTLRSFDFIMMEYHYGYGNLVAKLKGAGFSVRHTSPEFDYRPESAEEFKKMAIGYIFAARAKY